MYLRRIANVAGVEDKEFVEFMKGREVDEIVKGYE